MDTRIINTVTEFPCVQRSTVTHTQATTRRRHTQRLSLSRTWRAWKGQRRGVFRNERMPGIAVWNSSNSVWPWNEVKESAGSKVPATLHVFPSQLWSTSRAFPGNGPGQPSNYFRTRSKWDDDGLIRRRINRTVSCPSFPWFRFIRFDVGIWSNGVLYQGWRRTGERKVHVLTAKVNPSPPPLDFYLRAYGSGRMGRKVDDCLIKFERKFLFLVSASEAGFTVERDELRRYDRAFAWIYISNNDSWKDNVKIKSNYFRENLAIILTSWNIYQWFKSNTRNDNFDILKNHREERITIYIELLLRKIKTCRRSNILDPVWQQYEHPGSFLFFSTMIEQIPRRDGVYNFLPKWLESCAPINLDDRGTDDLAPVTEAKLCHRWKQRERGVHTWMETIIHRNGVRLAKAKVEAPWRWRVFSWNVPRNEHSLRNGWLVDTVPRAAREVARFNGTAHKLWTKKPSVMPCSKVKRTFSSTCLLSSEDASSLRYPERFWWGGICAYLWWNEIWIVWVTYKRKSILKLKCIS